MRNTLDLGAPGYILQELEQNVEDIDANPELHAGLRLMVEALKNIVAQFKVLNVRVETLSELRQYDREKVK